MQGTGHDPMAPESGSPRFCGQCAPAPRGVEGHDALFPFDSEPRAAAPGTALFRCAGCHTLWGRTYAGGGQFDWTLVEQGETMARRYG